MSNNLTVEEIEAILGNGESPDESASVPLFEAGDIDDPALVPTSQSWFSNPIVRLAAVGGTIGLGIAGVGVVLIPKEASQSGTTASPITSLSPSNTQDSALATENDQLRQDRAFSSQKDDIQALKEQRLKASQNKKPKSPPPPIVQRAPVIQQPSIIQQTPIIRPVIPQAITPVIPPPKQLTPEEQYEQLASAGVYGFVAPSSTETTTAEVSPTNPTESTNNVATLQNTATLEESPPVATSVPDIAAQPSTTTATLELPGATEQPTTAATPGLTPPASAARPSDVVVGGSPLASMVATNLEPSFRRAKKLVIGTKATGTTSNAISSMEQQSGVDPQRVLIQLNQPLASDRGDTIIPAGAQIAAQVQYLGESSGFVSLQAVSVILDNQEFKLPRNSLVITDKEGVPLLAEKVTVNDGGRRRRERAAVANSLLAQTLGNSIGNQGFGQTAAANILSSALQQQAIRNAQNAEQPEIVRTLPAGKQVEVQVRQAVLFQ